MQSFRFIDINIYSYTLNVIHKNVYIHIFSKKKYSGIQIIIRVYISLF